MKKKIIITSIIKNCSFIVRYFISLINSATKCSEYPPSLPNSMFSQTWEIGSLSFLATYFELGFLTQNSCLKVGIWTPLNLQIILLWTKNLMCEMQIQISTVKFSSYSWIKPWETWCDVTDEVTLSGLYLRSPEVLSCLNYPMILSS